MIGIKIPWQVWACTGLVALIAGWGELRHHQGKKEVQAEWDAAVERGGKIVATLKEGQGRITIRTVTQYKDRIKVIREKGDTRTEYIVKYVDSDSCRLSGSFRLLHDAAALNTVPGDSSGVESHTVPAGDLARTVNRNYSRYYQCREQVIGLLRFAEDQRALYEEVCKQPSVDCSKGSL